MIVTGALDDVQFDDLLLERVVLVGDRGMITETRLEETLKPAGLDWITALRAPAIRSLVEAGVIHQLVMCRLVQSPTASSMRLVRLRNAPIAPLHEASLSR